MGAVNNKHNAPTLACHASEQSLINKPLRLIMCTVVMSESSCFTNSEMEEHNTNLRLFGFPLTSCLSGILIARKDKHGMIYHARVCIPLAYMYNTTFILIL